MDEWIFFLKNEEVRDDFNARGLKEAREALDILKLDKAERAQYEAYLEELRYQASMTLSTYHVGHLDGEKQGRRKEKLATAAKMREEGFSRDQICMITGLTPEEADELSRRR